MARSSLKRRAVLEVLEPPGFALPSPVAHEDMASAFQLTAATPASAAMWSFSTVLPLTPIAPITLAAASLIGGWRWLDSNA